VSDPSPAVSEPSPAPTRVLIADAGSTTRTGLRLALEGHGFTVCAEPTSSGEAVEAAVRERPEVCLIDVGLPGGGIAAAEQIAGSVPGTSVVMLSAAPNDDDLFPSLLAGARGFLLKDMDPARLPLALRGVLGGEAAVPRALVGRVLDEFRARDRGRYARELSRLGVELTVREAQIFELLDRGLDTSEIADRLAISAVTVRRHVSEILRKLEAPDRATALRIVREARD
jgi:DNA-binding NarL/FixJ family response regulator